MMNTPNRLPSARRLAVAAAAVFALSALTGCGQPAQEADAPESVMESPASAVAPTQAVDTPEAQTLSSEEAAEKATLLDAISIAESAVESAEQSQAERQALLDAAAEQTDVQLQQAAEAAENADTP